MTASILGLKWAQTSFIVSSNAASITALNDETFKCLDLFKTISTTLHTK